MLRSNSSVVAAIGFLALAGWLGCSSPELADTLDGDALTDSQTEDMDTNSGTDSGSNPDQQEPAPSDTAGEGSGDAGSEEPADSGNPGEADDPDGAVEPEDPGSGSEGPTDGGEPGDPADTGGEGDSSGDGGSDAGDGSDIIEEPEPAPEPVPQTFTLEPDDFADGTELTQVDPNVRLRTTLDDGRIVSLFEITATEDGQDLAPTGLQVFGHVNIPFFNDNRRLRMDFPIPASSVQITFAGGTFNDTEVGLLKAFDGGGNLLAEYVTSPRGPGETEIMSISRPTADIAWAIAYSEDDFTFGRLDHLVYTIWTLP